MGAEVTSADPAIVKTGRDGREQRFASSLTREFEVAPDVLFGAWADRFDEWFAEPGAISRRLEVGAPYFFETVHAGRRHPHYGRILAFDPGRLLEMTWLNEAGTRGVETVVRVEVAAAGAGSRLYLTHGGFRDEETSRQHGEAWSELLRDRLAPLLGAGAATS